MSVDYGDAALAAARRYCGWVVTPPETVTVIVDGPGGQVLSLPTLHLSEVVSVVEDGAALDVANLRVITGRGELVKKSGCWARGLGVIQVKFTHGFDEAPDFDAAVEQAAQALSTAATRSDSSLKRKKIDDVEYEWFESASSFLNQSLLSPYRILPSP
jgi:hypothetical protein